LISEYKASQGLYAEIKQKYQNGNIHQKLTVPTSERENTLSNPRARAARARCMEKIYGNLRKLARARAARALCSYFVPPRGTVLKKRLKRLEHTYRNT
jgi:hypothetical protein